MVGREPTNLSQRLTTDYGRIVPNPRYVPRTFAVHPAMFGHDWNIEWHIPGDRQQQIAAVGARLQHGIAWHTRKAIRRSPHGHRSVRAFADANQISYARLSAMLRGEIIMRLDDTAHLCQLLDLTIKLPLPSAISTSMR